MIDDQRHEILVRSNPLSEEIMEVTLRHFDDLQHRRPRTIIEHR
jgi:hypothetical protein